MAPIRYEFEKEGDYIKGGNLTASTSFELPTIIIEKTNMNPIDTHLIKDTKKRTAMRHKEQEVESPYIWLAIPILLISWIFIRWIIG